MIKKSLTAHAKSQIKTIHNFSKRYNKLLEKNHRKVLLTLIKDHAEEISQLHKAKDPHYIIETGDMLILCLELIKEGGYSINGILSKCYNRYHKKLPKLIEEAKSRKKG